MESFEKELKKIYQEQKIENDLKQKNKVVFLTFLFGFMFFILLEKSYK